MEGSLLTLLVFLPTAGAAVLAILPPEANATLRRLAFLIALLPLVLACRLWLEFDPVTPGFQLVERSDWIAPLGVSYLIGVDGISLLLILLTVFLTPLVIVAARDSVHQRLKAYLIAVLLLETTMLGTLVALDLILFYVFWELMLVPMYLIIGVWGGERRVYAAVKFLLFTMVGSLPMLAAIIYMGVQYAAQPDLGGHPSFALMDLYGLRLSREAQLWSCAALALAFAVKVPMWPLHTWLPDAHVEAPTGGSVILAGVLLKLGAYGFLRFVMPLFPAVLPVLMPLVAVLSLVGIVYGALVAMVQPDMKKLVAYSSVSHLGFVMLGLASMTHTGIAGAVFQMVAHGLSTGGLFFLVGVIYEKRHTRLIEAFGGLWKPMPRYAACFLVIALASIGLPGLCGFVGEFLILIGAFRAEPAWAAIAASGMVLGAVYMLWLYQRVMFGPVRHQQNQGLTDIGAREMAIFAPIIAMTVLLGVWPQPVLTRIDTAVATALARSASASAGGGAPPTGSRLAAVPAPAHEGVWPR
jgi:NADH-quinone oxidoreductase subunit M